MRNHLPHFEIQKKLLGLTDQSHGATNKNQNDFPQLLNLRFVKKITRFRHQDYLEKYCFFTSRFLKSIGQMEVVSARYFQSNNHCNSAEEIRPQFLAWLLKNTKGLTSVIARFETGMTAVHLGQAYDDEFIWPCDPLPVIHGLVAGNLSDESIQPGKYRMILSDKILSIFEVEKIDSIVSVKSFAQQGIRNN